MTAVAPPPRRAGAPRRAWQAIQRRASSPSPPPVAERPELRLRLRTVVIAFVTFTVFQIVAFGIAAAVSGTPSEGRRLFSAAFSVPALVADGLTVALLLWLARRETADARRTLGLVRPRWRRAAAVAVPGWIIVNVLTVALLEPLLHGSESQGLTPNRFPGGTSAVIGV